MLPSFPTLLPFLLFALVASITPGPTNILVLSNSARYGLAAAVPIIFGACAGAATMVLLVGTSAGSSLAAWPALQTVMQWAGVTWLSYLAWQIFRAPTVAISAQKTERRLGRFGAGGGQRVCRGWRTAPGSRAVSVAGVLSDFPALPRRLGAARRGLHTMAAFTPGHAALQPLHGPVSAGFKLAERVGLIPIDEALVSGVF